MDIGKPLVEYGPVDITELREKMLGQPKEFWEIDRASRVKLAGDRPGNAVYFYNDKPSFISRPTVLEAQSGFVSVLRYANRPLFDEIQKLIDKQIKPKFSNCDVMRVQLAELPPGSEIEPHVDKHILARIHRLHIPIATHEGVKFIIAGQTFFLQEGRLYDLNNVVKHSVENKSNLMRVHLMIDMLPHLVAQARYYDTDASMKSAFEAWLGSQPPRPSAGTRPDE